MLFGYCGFVTANSTRGGSTAPMTSTLCLPHAAVAVVSAVYLHLALYEVYVRHFGFTCLSLCSGSPASSGEFVVGRVIRAMSQCWHPNCFKCVSCHTELADIGFVKSQGRSVRALRSSLTIAQCILYVCMLCGWVCMCCASLPSTTLAQCPHLDIC